MNRSRAKNVGTARVPRSSLADSLAPYLRTLSVYPSRRVQVSTPAPRRRATWVAVALSFLYVGCDDRRIPVYGASGSEGSDATSEATSSDFNFTSSTPASSAPTFTPGAPSSSDFDPTVTVSSSSEPASTTEQAPPLPDRLSLHGAPLVFAPTATAFSVSAVVLAGDPVNLTAQFRRAGAAEWTAAADPWVRGADVAQWTFTGLEPDARYEYRIVAEEPDAAARILFEGRALTRRSSGAEFTFAMISDTHIGPDLEFHNQGDEALTGRISAELLEKQPDFLMNLGDLLDYHQFGFNVAPSDASLARAAYQNYRGALGNTIGHLAHFSAVGNWDGENGDFTDQEIMRSREQRMVYVPNPGPDTYPEGGSPGEDYYAFTWGDATFVVLNVMTYTTTPHLLTGFNEYPDDWTLGSQQLAWLEDTLAAATTRWKFLFIHHAVGGAGPSPANAAYGRGGGLAAYVGEQAVVHQMMLDHGAQFFFHGHDHVFVDMTVDGIHYTDPGSAGAPWKFSEAETGYTQYWSDSGWAQVHVSPERVHVEFFAEGGTLLHAYTVDGAPLESPDAGAFSDASVQSETAPHFDAAP